MNGAEMLLPWHTGNLGSGLNPKKVGTGAKLVRMELPLQHPGILMDEKHFKFSCKMSVVER